MTGGPPALAEALNDRYVLQRELGRGGGLPHVARARFYAILGDRASALTELEKAVAERDGPMEWIKVEPAWAPLRDDPRFPALVARMGLPP
jgi:hypothetical protein